MIQLLVLLALGGLMHAAGTFAPNSATLAGPELAFGFLLLCAYFAGKLVSRFGLPKLTGYILAGIAVGPAVLGLVEKGMIADLKLVGGVATSILALQAGLELSLREVRPLLRTVNAIALYAVLGTMLLLTAALLAIRPMVGFLDALPLATAAAVASTIAVALTAQSPAVVMALIGETRADGVLTRTILASVVISDLAVIVAFGVASAGASAVVRGEADVAAAAGRIGWEVFGSLGLGLVAGLVLSRFLIHVGRGAGMFTVVLCVVIAEVASAIHLDALIIMLTAGILVRNFTRADAHALLDGIVGASLPVYLVFFALAGAKLDLAVLLTLAVPVGVIVIARATGFYVGSRVACRRSDADPLVARFGWLGLCPQAGLALALAELVKRAFPEFGDDAFALVVGVVATNEMVMPIALRLALLRSGEAGRRSAHELAGSH